MLLHHHGGLAWLGQRMAAAHASCECMWARDLPRSLVALPGYPGRSTRHTPFMQYILLDPNKVYLDEYLHKSRRRGQKEGPKTDTFLWPIANAQKQGVIFGTLPAWKLHTYRTVLSLLTIWMFINTFVTLNFNSTAQVLITKPLQALQADTM